MRKYDARRNFENQLKFIKKLNKEIRLLTCEVLRHDGKNAVEIGEMMGLKPRQVHYQWKLARRRGYYAVPTEFLEELAKTNAELHVRAALDARDLIVKVRDSKKARLAGYTTKI